MGLLSSSVSMTRYMVDGELKKPILETIAAGLKKYSIVDIDNDPTETSVGWTSFNKPFQPDFNDSSFVVGTYLVFSLRLDKKNIPSKIIKKYFSLEVEKKLKESGREYLSRNEQKIIKDHIINFLSVKIPATPNIYDIIWNYENKNICFFSNLKGANEALETLFNKTFHINLIRLFPYTIADLKTGLSTKERDCLAKLNSTNLSSLVD